MQHLDNSPVSSVVKFNIAHEEQTAAYDADDLLAELCEIGEPLLSAVRAKDAYLIGRLVLAVVAAQIERRACIVCEQESAGVYADMAAAVVMRTLAEDRASMARRIAAFEREGLATTLVKVPFVNAKQSDSAAGSAT